MFISLYKPQLSERIVYLQVKAQLFDFFQKIAIHRQWQIYTFSLSAQTDNHFLECTFLADYNEDYEGNRKL